MSAIKSLLAISVLAAAGAAHAATVATFNVSETGSSAYTTQSLTGIGTLDDGGTLTINLSGTFDASAVGFGIANVTTTNVFSGSIVGDLFTPTSGKAETNTCTGAAICNYIAKNSFTTLTSFSGNVSLSGGGTLTGTISGSGQSNIATDTLTPTTPAVPVPAAAWLFGSGLLGLAGSARRRVKNVG